MNPILQFYLKNGSLYYAVQDGHVVLTSTETPLRHAPDGWMDTEINWSRSEVYHGLTRTFTTPYTFDNDGAAILRYIYFTEGIDGACSLAIKKLRSFDQLYEDYYQGDIDFSKIVIANYTVQANIMEGGLSALIKAYENTAFEIPFETDSLLVGFDGIVLRNNYRYGTLAGTGTLNTSPNLKARSFKHFFIDKEADYSNGITNDTTDIVMDTSFAFNSAPQNNHVYEAATTSQDLYVGLKLPVSYQNGGSLSPVPVKLRVQVLRWSNALQAVDLILTLYTDSSFLNPGNTRSVTIDGHVTLTLAPLDRVYVEYNVVNSSGNPPTSGNSAAVTYPDSDDALNIGVDFRLLPSTSAGYRMSQVFSKLTAKITSGQYSAVSGLLGTSYPVALPGYYDNIPYNIAVTSGDSLRNLYTNTAGAFTLPKIITNLSDFFKACWAIWPVGLGVENDQLRLEHISYFFDANTMIADLGEVTDLEIVPAPYLQPGNSINVGYPVADLDRLNGRDEPLNQQTYKLPIIRKPGTIDWTCPYVPSIYSIEYTRANLNGKKTTDTAADNDTFMVEVNSAPSGSPAAYYPLRLQTVIGNSASGVLSPASAFNISLSPKRNLLRHGAWLRMMNYLKDGKDITFQTADKNSSLVSNLGSGVVTEKADVPVSTLPALPFLPVFIRFKKSLANLNALMATNPKGYFYLTYLGRWYKGFIEDVAVFPGRLDAYEFQLLAHPDNPYIVL